MDVVLFGLLGASHESSKIKHAKIKQTHIFKTPKSAIVYGNEPLQIVIMKEFTTQFKITHTKIKHMPPERKPKFPNLLYALWISC